MRIQRVRAALAVASLAFTAGCYQSDIDRGKQVDPKLVQQLAERVQRLEDTLAIQKLQAKYVNYLFLQRYDKIFDELYAQKNPDVSVEFSDSGIYRGHDGVRALYHAFDVTKLSPTGTIVRRPGLPPVRTPTSRFRQTVSRPAASGSRRASRAATRQRAGSSAPTTSTM